MRMLVVVGGISRSQRRMASVLLLRCAHGQPEPSLPEHGIRIVVLIFAYTGAAGMILRDECKVMSDNIVNAAV